MSLKLAVVSGVTWGWMAAREGTLNNVQYCGMR